MTNHVLEFCILLGVTWERIHVCPLSGIEISEYGENRSFVESTKGCQS